MKKSRAKKPAKKTENRGGPRLGAGRKPKPKSAADLAKLQPRQKKAVRADRAALVLTEQTNLARKYARLAIATLADVAVNALSENARVAAAEGLLQWGYGKPLGIGSQTLRPEAEKPAKAKPLGKKEELAEAAKNPDTSTPMGELMAQRAAQAKLNS